MNQYNLYDIKVLGKNISLTLINLNTTLGHHYFHLNF